MAPQGILLYSGGLDSLLAARVLMEQGLELLGVQFILPFTPPDSDPEESEAAHGARSIKLPLRFYRCGRDYVEMVRNPSHGYGKHVNPCIDCKIFFLRAAKGIMKDENASFVATGDVVGQRPMSQMKHMLLHIEKESGLRGYLLRPLSAKLLRPTLAESAGIVDRERLHGISGRSRSMQMELAKKYAITEYSSPAGGCLLTDAAMESRIRDFFHHYEDFTMMDFYLITIGRHYRLNESVKIIVGRNERENLELQKYRDTADLYLLPEFKGPVIWVRGDTDGEIVRRILSVMARYGTYNEGNNVVRLYKKGVESGALSCSGPYTDKELDSMRI